MLCVVLENPIAILAEGMLTTSVRDKHGQKMSRLVRRFWVAK